MIRKLTSWFVAIALLAVAAYCGIVGWQLSSGVKQMVTVGGPFTNPPLQTRDPLALDYDGDPERAFGWSFETISISSELGPLPAWVVPPASGRSATWMIDVHGIGAVRLFQHIQFVQAHAQIGAQGRLMGVARMQHMQIIPNQLQAQLDGARVLLGATVAA